MSEASAQELVRTFKFRLLPSKRQHASLVEILESQRQLYNAALEERIDCYRKTGRLISYVDQTKSLTAVRADGHNNLPVAIQRATLKRLDEAFRGFFRRVKRGEKAGFPRFRGYGRFDSFGFSEFEAIRLHGRRLRFKGLPGGLRVHMHRPLPDARLVGCQFRRDAKGWAVCLLVRERVTATHAGPAVGIDLGITSLAVLSTGERIQGPRAARRVEREMRRRQRALSRCQRGSNRRKKVRRKVARLHAKISNARATHLHQISADLTKRFGLIAVEDLNVKGLARSMLARDVHDAGWARLRGFLAYKAERAGGRLIAVDPKNTSQSCSGCGVIVPKQLKQRTHRCDCGTVLDRDHNAALNILHRAVAGPGVHNLRVA